MKSKSHISKLKCNGDSSNSSRPPKLDYSCVKQINSFFQTGKFPKKKTKKAKFTKEEDQLLCSLVKQYGDNEWSLISKKMNNRNARQVRERWKNYLNPQVNNDEWSQEEDFMLISKFTEIGPHWKEISYFFHNRSVNSIRNRFVKITGANNNYLKAFFNSEFYIPNPYQSFSYNYCNTLSNQHTTNCLQGNNLNQNISSELEKNEKKSSSILSSNPNSTDEKSSIFDLIKEDDIHDDYSEFYWDIGNNEDFDFQFSSNNDI